MVKVYFDFGVGWQEIEGAVKGFTVTETLYKNLKPADNNARLKIMPEQSVLNALRLATSEIPAKIEKDGTVIFTGYVRRTFNIKKTQRLQPATIELVNPSFLLKKPIGENLALINKKIIDNTTPANSIIHTLLDMAGITSLSVPTIDIALPIFRIEESEKYHAVLEKLLYEYGYVFDFNHLAQFVIYPVFIDDITTTKAFNGGNIIGRIQQTKKEISWNSCRVKFRELETLNNQVIFSDTTGATGTQKANIEVQPNSYFGKGEGNDSWYAEYNIEGKEILHASGVTLDIRKDADILVEEFTPYPTKAKLKIKNSSTTFSRFITRLDIKGTVIAVKSDNVSIAETGDIINECDASYIFEKIHADYLASGLLWYADKSDFSYTLQSYTDYQIGDVVIISEDGIGEITARIVEKQTDIQNNLFTYTADGVSDFLPVVVSSLVTAGGRASNTQVNNIIDVVDAGLTDSGGVKQPINSNDMIVDLDPSGDGLYLTKSFVGLYQGGMRKSYIDIDGNFEFNKSDSYIKSTETGVKVKGEIQADQGLIGGWTISGDKLSASDMEIKSDGNIIAGSGNSAVYISATNAAGALWAGNTQPGVAPFLVTKAGILKATAGTIGGFHLGVDYLQSDIAGARIVLNKKRNRIEIFDDLAPVNAMGFLYGLPKRDGSGNWGVGDRGFWALPGHKLHIDGDMEYIAGDWLIDHDASLIIENELLDAVAVRLGSDTGEFGLWLLPDKIGNDYRARLTSKSFFVGNDVSHISYDATTQDLELLLVTFKVSSLQTNVKGELRISQAGTVDALTNPLVLTTNSIASYGIIGQQTALYLQVGGVDKVKVMSGSTTVLDKFNAVGLTAIGSTDAQGYNLHVTGTMRVTSSVTMDGTLSVVGNASVLGRQAIGGTDAQGYNLHVTGTMMVTSDIGVGGNASNTYSGLTINGTNPSLKLNSDHASGWSWIEFTNEVGTNYGQIGVFGNGVDGIRFKTTGAGIDNPDMVLDSSGNVGIGTTDPQGNKLLVAGEARIDNSLTADTLILSNDNHSIRQNYIISRKRIAPGGTALLYHLCQINNAPGSAGGAERGGISGTIRFPENFGYLHSPVLHFIIRTRYGYTCNYWWEGTAAGSYSYLYITNDGSNNFNLYLQTTSYSMVVCDFYGYSAGFVSPTVVSSHIGTVVDAMLMNTGVNAIVSDVAIGTSDSQGYKLRVVGSVKFDSSLLTAGTASFSSTVTVSGALRARSMGSRTRTATTYSSYGTYYYNIPEGFSYFHITAPNESFVELQILDSGGTWRAMSSTTTFTNGHSGLHFGDVLLFSRFKIVVAGQHAPNTVTVTRISLY